MSNLDTAIAFAAHAHAGQRRKYTGEPYVVHPIEVMTLVHTYATPATEDMLAAAVLHDVVEDTVVGLDSISRRFGFNVAIMVGELTDRFTKEAFPELNRKARKAKEAERLRDISAEAATIKLADLISNTRSIAEHDKGFAKTYLVEKTEALNSLGHGDKALFDIALDTLVSAKQLVGVA